MSYNIPSHVLLGYAQAEKPNFPWKKDSRLVVSTAICVWIAGLAYTFCAFEPVFQSKASVLVRDSVVKAKYITDDEHQTTSSPSANPVLNSVELLKSNVIRDHLWTKVISPNSDILKSLHLKTQDDWNQYYGDGRKLIKYNNPPGTDVIQLTLSWNDPKIAQQVLTSILEGFQETSMQLNKTEHHERYVYLQERISHVKSQLAELRKYISHIKSEHQVVDINNEMEQYSKYHMEFKLASALASAESAQNAKKLQTYSRTLQMAPGNAAQAVGMGTNPTMQGLVKKLYEQKEELSTLKARYTDEHSKVQAVRSSIEQTESDMKNEAKRLGISPNVKVISDDTRGKAIENMIESNSQAAGSNQRSLVLKHDLTSFENRMKELPKIEETLKELQDNESSLANSLKTLESKSLDELIREDQTLSNIFVVTPADMPESAKFPSKNHMLILTFLAGIIAAFLVFKIKTNNIKLGSVAKLWPLENDHKVEQTLVTGNGSKV